MEAEKESSAKRTPLLSLFAIGVVCALTFLVAFGLSNYSLQFENFKVDTDRAATKGNVHVRYKREVNSSSEKNIQYKRNIVKNCTQDKKLSAECDEVGLVTVEDKASSYDDVNEDSRGNKSTVSMDALSLRSKWKLCEWKGAIDFIPCLDNTKAIKKLRSHRHMEDKERHCPSDEERRRCLLPLPGGYTPHIAWPKSRDMIWLNNVPHTKLVEYKRSQNWVTISGRFLVFPGGGTQFKDGAAHYISFIEKIFPEIAWGRHVRVVLDVGCGVASFGGYLFDRHVLTMSIAPRDGHEAQIQLALERGIPAFLSVIGTQRLVFPSNVYDMVHCARCRVHWHGDGGKPLLEINRVLRPGGYFVWSATPVYHDDSKDQDTWKAVSTLAESMCWILVVKKEDSRGIGVAIYQKPTSNTCYSYRKQNEPPLCQEDDMPDSAWYTPMQRCIHKLSMQNTTESVAWQSPWPSRLESTGLWINKSVETSDESGKSYNEDTNLWRNIVNHLYLHHFPIDWKRIRNVMDMNARYGGFAAALSDAEVWVMNVVPINRDNTLPQIFERGLIGVYHDWCEAFNTYPRTYDLLHAYRVFSSLRCDWIDVLIEVDRILRPQGWLIINDTPTVLENLLPFIRSLHWNTTRHKNIIAAQKGFWRPQDKEKLH